MKQYDGLTLTAADFLIKFWSGGVAVLAATLVLAAPSLVVAQSFNPSLLPYVKLVVPCVVVYIVAITMTKEEDEITETGDYSLQVFLIFTVTNALYLSTVVLLSATLANFVSPFSAATYLSTAVAVLYPYLDMAMLRRLPISPVGAPIYLLAILLVKLTPMDVDLRDVPLLGSVSTSLQSPSS